MDKQTFLKLMQDELTAFGMENGEIEKYTINFNKYLATLTDEELNNDFPSEEDVKALAKNIFKKYLRQITTEEKAEDFNTTESKPEDKILPDNETADIKVEENNNTADEESSQDELPGFVYEQATRVFNTTDTKKAVQAKNEMTTDALNVVFSDNRLKKPKISENTLNKNKKRSTPGSPLFWLLFVLTLPITVPVVVAVLVLFGSVYLAISVLIIALVAVMVSIIAAGTALALIGIIYGIIKIFNVFPIGLYEIGLGVIIGGITMLISVLIYNFGVRMLPKLYKHINMFAKFVFEKSREFYQLCKEECGKQ